MFVNLMELKIAALSEAFAVRRVIKELSSHYLLWILFVLLVPSANLTIATIFHPIPSIVAQRIVCILLTISYLRHFFLPVHRFLCGLQTLLF